VPVLGDGVAGALLEEGGEVTVAGDRDLPLEPLAKMRAPLAELYPGSVQIGGWSGATSRA
jgi:hypothetical protein